MSTVLAFKNPKPGSPRVINGQVSPPQRVANLERRSREHLTPPEVERLIAAATKAGRHGLRDGTLILLALLTRAHIEPFGLRPNGATPFAA